MRSGLCFALMLSSCLAASPVSAATANRVVSAISSDARVTITQTVPGRARLAADQGNADPALALTSLTLRFSLSDANQAALTELLLEQQQPGSANYHKWLTPEQFGARFGLSSSDLAKVSGWLTAQGFTVTGTARSGTFVSFSGTAAQVEHAFGTTIHRVTLGGESHYTNLTDPTIPAALAGVVSGITGLHDFKLVPRSKVRMVPAPAANVLHPEFTSSTSGNHYMAPGDFYTIYDENPLLTSSINGSGITIAIMGQTDISLPDVAAFRSASGLTASAPTVMVVGGKDPGLSSTDLPEAQLDVEWSGAAAPAATILYVNSTDVINVSLTQAIDSNLAPIMSVSYGDCEAAYGAANLRTLNQLFQQANAQGITVVGPGGDSGAADCDYQVTSAVSGLAVDYPASSPYVTGVGGTQFNEGAGTYFSTTNGANMGSALSYIPEAAWNETAADTAAANGIPQDIAAGGGGASAFFTKPAWQVGTGVPADVSRDVPDISLNASAAHDGYLFCTSGSCVSGYRTATGNLAVVGGTSAATPSFAGLLALVEQKIGARIGNANPILYSLANSTYAPNVFHDVTTGSNAVPCTTGTPNCPNGGTIGFNAATGYDLATGWGSVDAFNMVNDWSLVTALGAGAGQTASLTTLTASATGATIGTTLTFTAAVASGTGTGPTTPTGTVQLLVDGVLTGSAVALSGGSASLPLATGSLSSGTHTVTAAYSGDSTYTGSKGSASIDLTSASSADFSVAGSVATVAVTAGGTAAGVTYTLTSLNNFAGSVTLSASTTAALNASANFSVSPVTLTAGGTGTSVFTFYAYTSNAGAAPVGLSVGTRASQARLTPFRLAGGGLAFTSLVLLFLPRRKVHPRATRLLSLVLLSVAAIGMSGCGSAGSTATTSSTVNSAKGTYLLTITATSGAISHSTSLSVVVQ